MADERRNAAEHADTQHDASAEARQGFTEQDVEDIEDSSRLRAPMIYEVVRREGEEEMCRPSISLWWSGLAAGLSISFSLLTEAVLQLHLPDAPWRPLIRGLGYPVGFLIVVLARQQLFTENTITVVLPVAAEPTARNFGRLGRMWTIVFLANMAGTLIAAAFYTFTPVLSPALRDGMLEISRHMMENGWAAMLAKGVASGFLIAAMVWLIPSAEGTQFHIIALMTYLIAVADFTHIVAGSVDAFMLVVNGQLPLWHMVAGFTAPVLLGNIVGGTALFALISYAQIMKEL